MANPHTDWLYSSQTLIAFNMASMSFTSVTDNYDVAFLSLVAVIAQPIHDLVIGGMVLELL